MGLIIKKGAPAAKPTVTPPAPAAESVAVQHLQSIATPAQILAEGIKAAGYAAESAPTAAPVQSVADAKPQQLEKVGYCAVCKNPQYATPSGPVCNDGHGGAETLTAAEAGRDEYLDGITEKDEPKGSPELQEAMDTIAKLPPTPAAKPTPDSLAAQLPGMKVVDFNGIKTLVQRRATDTPAVIESTPAASSSPFEDTPLPPKTETKTVELDAIQQAEVHPYTMFTALEEFAAGTRVGTLMLSHRESGLTYTVLGYNPKTRVAIMKNSAGLKIHPALTDREALIYVPMWR